MELLPDRESETFTRWLKAHPGTEVVSHDRSEKCAAGAHRGASEAVQMAGRWHLTANRREAVQRVVKRHRGWLKRVASSDPESEYEPTSADSSAKRVGPDATRSKSGELTHKRKGKHATKRSAIGMPRANT